jgi:transposase-like protein
VVADNPIHEVKPHLFLGLEREPEACNCFRKSLFIDASSLRVGTLRNASFFSCSVGVLTMTLPDVVELFDTDEKCRELLERLRWPADPECPRCHTHTLARLDARLLYCKDCDYQFSVTAGTIFHDSHLPLTKWFMAVLLLCEAKKGMSALQLKRTIWGMHKGSYKTAWYLCHRIRAAMKETERPMLDGTVEMDETYIGGKQHTYSKAGYGDSNKQIVIGIRQRGADLRFFHAQDVKSGTLAQFIRENVSEDVDVIMTDELNAYPTAMKSIAMTAKHKTIKHKAKVYVDGDIHTNTVESAFSLLKRGIIGTWHRISAKHLAAYLDEMSFRFNRRKNANLFLDTLRHMITAPVLTFEKLTA